MLDRETEAAVAAAVPVLWLDIIRGQHDVHRVQKLLVQHFRRARTKRVTKTSTCVGIADAFVGAFLSERKKKCLKLTANAILRSRQASNSEKRHEHAYTAELKYKANSLMIRKTYYITLLGWNASH